MDGKNIYNYDKTKVVDDPSVKKCIVRWGLRHVERKVAHSKSATSLMFCGNAEGKYLPPMVVYKAKTIYDGWTLEGPTGALYCTQSEWFDSHLLEKWFFDLFLEHVKGDADKNVLIGNNLASHFTTNVLEACQEHAIVFVSLVSNCSHLLQPLDASAFGPAKTVWRNMVNEWRKEARTKSSIPKRVFPKLLKKLCDEMPSANLKSGLWHLSP